MLTMDNVAVQAGGTPLLKGLTIRLEPGELVGLAGPSGCGKTTLLRAIAGLVDPLEGRITLNDKNPDAHGWPVYRRQVILVQQRPALFEGTVEENLERPFRYRSAGRTFPREDALRLLDAFLIESERLTQSARSLSEGQQQRVCLVRALLLEPRVLLLDEPTSALDASAVEAVELVLRNEVTHRNAAALIVTHDRTQAERWCDRTIVLGEESIHA